MNKAQAWRYCAKIFSGELSRNELGYLGIQTKFGFVAGVCHVVDILKRIGRITQGTADEMRSVLDFQVKKRNSTQAPYYAWPLTKSGDKARVKFCLTQAKKEATK
jgi:hypothetical protein